MFTFTVAMEEVHQNTTNGTESQTVTIPTTITASQLSQITQVFGMCVRSIINVLFSF